MVPFVLLTTQRSGSTVLVRTLDQHPGVFCAGELLYHGTGIHHEEARFDFWTPFVSERFGRLGKALRTAQLQLRLRGFVADFYARREREGFRAAGFKVMYSQIQHVGAFRSILGAGAAAPRLLVLLREDLLAMALSLERARRSGQFHYSESAGAEPQAPIEVDVARTIADIRWMEAQNRHILALAEGLPHHRIRYEDFGDWDRVMAGVLTTLGLEPAGSLAPALRKIGSRAPREEIANFEALREGLARNGLGHLADDARPSAAG